MNINFNAVLNTLASKAKALALNVTDIELKVLEATNEEPWGPHGKDMQDIARAAEDPTKYNLVMNVISERLQMRDENWRLCYKALLLLEYLVKHGPWRVVDELNRSVSSLERLRDEFEYKDSQGRDHGINIRQRAGELASLVCNMDRVRQEREKAARNASKFKGVSSSDVQGGFGGFGSSSYSSGYSGGSNGYGGFGGGIRTQGFGSKESNHMPASSSSFHNRTGSASSSSAGAMGPSGRREETGSLPRATGNGEEAEDPFEATRKRIERLKAEGALQESPAGGPPPGLVDPATASAKVPKKLSDVKISPAVAATFASISVPSSNSTGNLVKLAPPPQPGSSVKPSSGSLIQEQNSSNDGTLDLFANDQPQSSNSRPASMQQQSLSSSSGAAATSGLDWDAAFGAAAPTVAVPAAVVPTVAEDPFAEFTSATPVPVAVIAPAATVSTGLNSLLDGGASNSSASVTATLVNTRPLVREPLPFDAFAEIGDQASTLMNLPMASGLSASAAAVLPGPAATPYADPFAALASSSSSAPAPPTAAFRPPPATVQPVPAVAADPFTALSASRAPTATSVPTISAPLVKPTPSAALPFDAFGMAGPQPARTSFPAPPVASASTPASDPFAALASSSTPTPVPMATAARTILQSQSSVTGAAAAFDPFSLTPVGHAITAQAPVVVFDAFGSGVAAPPLVPQPQPPVSSFANLFGTSSPGQNGHSVAASKPSLAPITTVVTPASSVADPFATSSSSFPVPPPPPPAAHMMASTAAPTAHGAANGTTIAMNKSGAAHGVVGHKNHDPFAGLGF